MSATAKKKRIGRPKGSTKANAKLVLIPQTRVTPEQLRVLERQPGITLADKLRRLLDHVLEEEQDARDAKEATRRLAAEKAVSYDDARTSWGLDD